MKIVKKVSGDVLREDAHGGSGGRKLFVDDGEIRNFQGMTYGYLPAGNKFAWHLHESVNEVMLVIKGEGIVRDEDGEIHIVMEIFLFCLVGFCMRLRIWVNMKARWCL